MRHRQSSSRGFTLVAALMLLLLMSGLAIGLMMMVNTEQRAGNNDVQNSLAYRGAEAGIEQMTSSIAQQFLNIQAPNAAAIAALSVNQPSVPGITFTSYQVIPHTKAGPTGPVLDTDFHLISGGPNAGLYAQLIGVTLDATAQRPMGEQVHMMRDVEVALIPVFQFGAFSESDLSLFNSPTLDFMGRVHTNGDLYLGVSNGSTLTFHDKLTAFGNVIRMTYPNGSGVSNNDGPVRIPTASGGCDGAAPACRAMSTSGASYREGSTQGGANAAQNTNWPTISNVTYVSWIMDGNYGNGNAGTTPVKQLSLPFVSGNVQPYELIRRLPPFGQAATAADPSRDATLAQIRVLLSDTQAGLHLIDWNGDTADDIQLSNVGWAVNGVNVVNSNAMAGGNVTYFATANHDTTGTYKNPATNNVVKYDADFVQPWDTLTNAPRVSKQWPLIDGWLRVEAKWTDGLWHGVTREWLQYGFARGLTPPASSYANIHPNAILVFQMLADRNGNGNTTDANESSTVGGSDAQFNYFPINLYDAREGEARDWTAGTKPAAASCSVNGIMNAVELDVWNLKKWLARTGPYAGGTGNQVDSVTQNGYILYFSDRRGMLPNPNAPGGPAIQGEYGFEDVINNPQGDAATPDGNTEATVVIHTASGSASVSPEDTNLNGRVDTYGGVNVGDGFGVHAAVVAGAPNYNPLTTRIANCYTTGRKNRVTGARHVLKLTDGGWDGASNGSKLPMPGFTVSSENPVYIQGDYNTYSGDGTWTLPNPVEPNPLTHAAAAVIADTVTLLSNNWLDTGYSTAPAGPTNTGSLYRPFDANLYRPATTTYYRTAIAAGKTINFPHPGYSTSTTYYGTDGGLHNFLRFLENWNGDSLYYKGSLVSLFYSTYNTGTFKCCNYMVYQPPVRNYRFDQLFENPQNLPPGTPMFKDVNNLTYRQDFTPAY